MNTRKKNLVLTVLFAVILVSLSGCGWLYQSSPSSEEVSENLVLSQVPDFEFTNQFGEAFGSEDVKGKVWIANMIFTSCPTVCTTMTPNMMLLQQKLDEADIDIEFVSFTVDPEFDDPEQLKIYGENYRVNFANWNFVTGYSQEEIAEFAKEAFQAIVMDIEDDNDILHATSFYLVDEDLQVVDRFDGLETDTEVVLDAIESLN